MNIQNYIMFTVSVKEEFLEKFTASSCLLAGRFVVDGGTA